MTNILKKLMVTLASLSVISCALSPIKERKSVSYEIVDSSLSGNLSQFNCPKNTSDKILYIAPMRAEPPYDSVKMYYQQESYQLASYNYSQWIAPAAELLTQNMIKKVTASCYYRDVVTNHAIADANYRLVTILLNQRQDLKESTPAARMIILAELIDMDKNSVVASKIFNLRQETAVGPAGYVQGINQLTTEFDRQLVDWLRQN